MTPINQPRATSGVLSLAASIAFVGISIFTTASAQAQSIGVNLGTGNNANRTLLNTDSAGVVAQTNWNNFSGASGSSGSLLNSTGAASGVSLSYTSGESFFVPGTPVTPDGKLLTGFISTNGGTPNGSINFSNITFGLYNVYIYINQDRNLEDVGISINGGANAIYKENNPDITANPVTFTLATPFTGPANAPTTGTAGNYILFSGLTSSALSIAFNNAGTYGTADRGGISGIQIVSAVPEPSSVALFVGGFVLLLTFQRFRSRRVS